MIFLKRKFKRDYIILEANDLSYRFKDKVTPKAFVKIEVNEDSNVLSLYAENLKVSDEGYRVVIINSDLETTELGEITLNNFGKGERIYNLSEDNEEIKAVCILHQKNILLIGFKGSKINDYEKLLFKDDSFDNIEYVEVNEEYEEYEYEYIEIEEYEDLEEDEEIQIEEIKVEEDIKDENEKYGDVEYVRTLNKKPLINDSKKSSSSDYLENIEKSIENNIESDVEGDIETDIEDGAQTLLMPRQIKKGLKMFKEVRPFSKDYIEKSRWWKIEITPITLCGYTMPNLGYINTLNYTMYSDTVMNSYKYRHYVFGVQYDDYNRRKYYIYGVPGKKDEQPDKGLTGFVKYQPCDTKNDSMGYWLCFVDCRTRKIVK
ncbi:MAG: hypothetical protein R3Y64_02525 [Peptostreptococcaceae bacterium]